MRDTPPGPRGSLLLGNLREGWRDPLGLLTRARIEHGPTPQVRFGPHRYVVAHREEDIRRVLLTHRDNYPKSMNYRGLRLVLGDGLLILEGDAWKRERKLAQPAFHHQSLVGFTETMSRCTADMLERWDRELDGRAFDVHEEMMRVTFRIVGLTLCSADLDEEARDMGEAISVALAFANQYAESLVRIPPWVPLPRNLRFRRAMQTLDRIILGIVESRRDSVGEHGDLLDLPMAARYQDGAAMTDRQLRDELMTLILAGHETTAVAMSWTWYLLSRHPEVARRVHEEARQVLADRPATFDDLRELTYTGRVVEEAMRLYPPAWIFERQAVRDDELGGYHIPAGTIVAVSPWTLHRDPDLWDNPEGFDPDRFAPEASAARSKYAYMPFGGGPRVCIGNHFALMEAKIILAMVAARYRLDLVSGHPIEPEPGITLRPRHGVRVVARRHAACASSVAAA